MGSGEGTREIHVGSLHGFDEHTCRLVSVGGHEIGIRAWNGELFAYENVCLHQGGPVCEGVLVGRVEALVGAGGELVEQRFSEESINLVCPWHGFEYDLRTGELVTDRSRRLRRFEVVTRGTEVYVVV